MKSKSSIIVALFFFSATLSTKAGELEVPPTLTQMKEKILSLAQAGLFDIETIATYLANGGDINAQNEEEEQLIHLAAAAGNTETLTFLLANGADANALDNYGESPIFSAVDGTHNEAIQLLIDNGANVNIRNKTGELPFHRAVYHHRKVQEVIDPLVREMQPYHSTILLLLNNGTNLNATDRAGRQPIHLIAETGFNKALQLLLEKGVNIHTMGPHQLPIHYTVGAGHPQTIELLLDYGADINALDAIGWQPIRHTPYADSGNLNTALFLLMNGADITLIPAELSEQLAKLIADVNRSTATLPVNISWEGEDVAITMAHVLKLAAGQNMKDLIKRIIKKGNGLTPADFEAALLGAATAGHIKIVKTPRNHMKQDVLLAPRLSEILPRVLARAASQGHIDTVEYLIANEPEISLSPAGLLLRRKLSSYEPDVIAANPRFQKLNHILNKLVEWQRTRTALPAVPTPEDPTRPPPLPPELLEYILQFAAQRALH